MKGLPLIRVSTLSGFVSFLDQIGSPTDKLLQECHLRRDQIADLHAMAPEAQLWQFIEKSGRLEGIQDLGKQTAERDDIVDQGLFGSLVLQPVTLRECLNGFVQFFVKHHSDGRGRFWWTQQGGEVFFVCNNPPYRYWIPGSTHAFDYSLVFMLKVLQAYLGPSWKPTRVYFRGPYVKAWESYEPLINVNLYFDCNYGIIVFPSLLLDSVRLRESPSLLTKDLSAYLQLPSSGSFADSLKVLMRSLLAQKVFDIKSVAEKIDISPRTLQRQLQQDQTSFSQLLENLRHELAMQKIAHTNLEFKAIAEELGYSTPGHFTRAFKGWTGKTPTQFRQQQKLMS